MIMICTVDPAKRDDLIAELTRCAIPFEEVVLHTAQGRTPAIKLEATAYILLWAGRLLTDN